MRELIIGKNDAGQRLDKFITKTIDIPTSLLYKSIRLKKIKVNRKRAENNTILQEGDTIQCFLAEEFFEKKANEHSFESITVKLDIIYEDASDEALKQYDYLIDATKEAPAATFESTVSITKWTKSLSLTQAVFINYYAATTQTASAKLLIWKEDATSLDPANAAYEAEMTWDATRGRYFAQSCEVYSSQLSNTLYACVEFTDAEGNVTYSDIDVYNAETYAVTVINNSSDTKMVDLCKKLVIYGEMARVQFAG